MIEQRISKDKIKEVETEFKNCTKKLITIEQIKTDSQRVIGEIRKQYKTNLYINQVEQQNINSLYDQYHL